MSEQPVTPAYGTPATPPPPPPGGYNYGSNYGPESYANPYANQAPAAPATSNGLAVAGMVIGILSLVFCWWGLFTLVMVVLAIVFGGVALKRANQGSPGKGMAIAGLSTGILGAFAYLVLGFASAGAFWII